MKELSRHSATLTAFKQLDPERIGGLYLRDVAEVVAQTDIGFMRRYNLATKALRLLGKSRHEGEIGMAYLPRIYPTIAHFESKGIIDSAWEENDDLPEDTPRRRTYKYLGMLGLDR